MAAADEGAGDGRSHMVGLVESLSKDLRHACALWEVGSNRAKVLRVSQRTLLVPRIRALIWFRFAQVAFRRPSTRWMAYLIQARVLRSTGAEIHPGATIGPGLNFAHTAGIVIGRDVVVGEDLVIFQGVTLGDSGSDRVGQPTIGNQVRLGAGAKVLGPVRLGDRCIVAANAVVVDDVPPDATVGGVPARRLPARTSP